MKNISKLVFLSIMVMGVTFNIAQASDPVNINVTGNVIASPCTLVDDGGATVSLGDIQATDLANAGSSSKSVDFKINFKDCPVGTTKIQTNFSGTADTDAPTTFANTGTAKNVSVKITNDDSQVKGPGSYFIDDVKADHTAQIWMNARAYTEKGEVTPGTINAVIVATLTYQ